MSQIQGISHIPGVRPEGAAASDGAKASGSFPEMLENMLGEVNRLQKESGTTVESFAKGEVSDVHQVMEAMTRADLSFRMLLEVRNKLVDAYQEVMRTRV